MDIVVFRQPRISCTLFSDQLLIATEASNYYKFTLALSIQQFQLHSSPFYFLNRGKFEEKAVNQTGTGGILDTQVPDFGGAN
jgi:hypothetical protein